MEEHKLESDLHWEEGQLLYPEHFESFGNFLRYHVDIKTGLMPFPWGVHKLDSELIGNNLHLKDFYVVMPDGLLLSRGNSSLEKIFQLPNPNEEEREYLTIFLVRTDIFSPNYKGKVCYKEWKLLLIEQQKLKDPKNAIPVIRVKRVSASLHNYVWELDQNFIPPTFKVTKNSYLHMLFSHILYRIQRSITTFPLDKGVEAHLKFQALYQSLTELLPYEIEKCEFSPYTYYLSWMRVLGFFKGVLEIETQREFSFPTYDHYNLTSTFQILYEETKKILEKIVLSKYIEKRFDRYPQSNRFKVILPAASEYYLLAWYSDESQIQWLKGATIGYEEGDQFYIEDLLQERRVGFTIQETENSDITDYKEGSLYLLRYKDKGVEKNLSATQERGLIIAGHTSSMPEALVLLISSK